jgi:fatty acid desaturase
VRGLTSPGSVVDAGPAAVRARGSDYAQLLRQIQRAGLLDRRPDYYLTKIAVTAALLIAGWAAFVAVGDSWWQLVVAAFLAFVFTQVGFIGHDAGHRQIFRSRRANHLLGLVHGNLGIGFSYGWWVDKHTRHHTHPNQEGKDPDIGGGVVAFTDGQVHASRGPVRFIVRHQRYLFFPLLMLEGIQLHVASVRALAGHRLRHRAWEALLLGMHAGGYLAAVFLVLPPVKAAVFIAVHQALFGVYLGSSFAPNHKGMPILTGDDQADFLRRQVLTSRNVRGGRSLDFMLGGLNYQIEHHLFPSMPRPNLRRSQPLVQSFCHQRGIAYHETSLLRSYAQALAHLHEVGRPLRPDRPGRHG